MAGKNSKQANDKQKKRKEKKKELAKDRTWKVVGASNDKCLQSEEKRKEDVELN